MIYTTQSTALDLSKALRFGEMKTAPFGIYLAKANVQQKLDRINDIQEFMKDYDPAKDVILLVGDPINVSLVMFHAICKAQEASVERIKTIRWVKTHDDYLLTTVEL